LAVYEDLTTIRTERRDGVLWTSLHRPERLNAFDARLHADVTLLLERIASDDSVAVVVLQGTGEAFSAGGDLRWFQNMTQPDLDALFHEARRIVQALLAIEQPLVASTRGPVIGLGATIALMCDFVVAADDSVFADPHVQIGVVAGDGGAAIWPLLCGLGRAKRYLMLGDQIDANEAERIGLVDWVVPASDVQARTDELATRLRNGPLQAIRGTKKALNKHLERAVADTLDLSLAVEKACFHSRDHEEAVNAFLEKRAPNYRAVH
jgi:enoyl-CoA hydratase